MISTEHELYIKKLKKEKLKITFFRIFILIAFLCLWEILADLKLIDPFLTSSPSRMFNSLIDFIKEGTIWTHIWVTS